MTQPSWSIHEAIKSHKGIKVTFWAIFGKGLGPVKLWKNGQCDAKIGKFLVEKWEKMSLFFTVRVLLPEPNKKRKTKLSGHAESQEPFLKEVITRNNFWFNLTKLLYNEFTKLENLKNFKPTSTLIK